LLVVFAMTGCGEVSSTDEEVADAPTQPVPVQAVAARLTTLQPELNLTGTISAVPERTAMVSPQQGGWVRQLAVVEGQTVKAGDLLVQLDPRAAQTDLGRAKATVAEKAAALKRLERGYLPQEIEQARKDRDKAQATADGLRQELVALEDLLQRQEISPVAYQSKAKAAAAAQAALASADAHLRLLEQGTPPETMDEARAQLEVAKADLERAQLTLEWCSITSPIDGVVVQLIARQGQYFDQAAPLARVMDLSRVFVQLRIPSRHFAEVQTGTAVVVELDSLPGRTFQGSVERISGEADPATGNVMVFAAIENTDGLLRPGLSCQARVSLPEIPDAIAVPIEAVADNSGRAVATVIRDGKAFETEVQTGVEAQNLIQIVQGVAAGDLVATVGGYGLPQGCPVQIVDHR
jgi:multidrug efflux pump subunit AcrA (membrane-fusion protein)